MPRVCGQTFSIDEEKLREVQRILGPQKFMCSYGLDPEDVKGWVCDRPPLFPERTERTARFQAWMDRADARAIADSVGAAIASVLILTNTLHYPTWRKRYGPNKWPTW